jgi:hypothetical protein
VLLVFEFLTGKGLCNNLLMETIDIPEDRSEEITALKELAEREIKRIEQMPQPVVRVCGPLTCDGPEGYERNAERLAQAEIILQSKGMTVWTFGEAEEEIFGKGYDHGNIFTYFHKPILASGHIKEAYFLPRWNESNGATLERNISIETNVAIKEFPEDWF